MVYTPTFGTGFEMGSTEVIPAALRNKPTVTTVPHTGTYGLEFAHSSDDGKYARFPFTGNAVDGAAWVYPTYDGSYPNRRCSFGVLLTDSKYVEVRYNGTWNLYIDGSLAATGTITTPASTWQHVQLRITIGNAGTVQTKVEGIPDIDYSGDTQPGATDQIAYVQFYATEWRYFAVDDLTFGTGDWPGDVRYEAIKPIADTATKEWSPSGGSINYALVNEVPPSTLSYVYSGGSAHKDLYDLGSWDGSIKTVDHIMQWTYAKKGTASVRGLKQLIKSGSTEDEGDEEALLTTWQYISRPIQNDPDTGIAWDESGINNLQAGQTSV